MRTLSVITTITSLQTSLYNIILCSACMQSTKVYYYNDSIPEVACNDEIVVFTIMAAIMLSVTNTHSNLILPVHRRSRNVHAILIILYNSYLIIISILHKTGVYESLVAIP